MWHKLCHSYNITLAGGICLILYSCSENSMPPQTFPADDTTRHTEPTSFKVFSTSMTWPRFGVTEALCYGRLSSLIGYTHTGASLTTPPNLYLLPNLDMCIRGNPTVELNWYMVCRPCRTYSICMTITKWFIYEMVRVQNSLGTKRLWTKRFGYGNDWTWSWRQFLGQNFPKQPDIVTTVCNTVSSFVQCTKCSGRHS